MQDNVIQRYVGTMEATNKQVSKRALAVGFATGFAAFMMFATYSLVCGECRGTGYYLEL